MPTEPEFLNPRAEIDARQRRLPHWRQGSVAVFATWRLVDALPFELRVRWRAERDEWLRTHPKPWSDETEAEYHAAFSAQLDRWLDAGNGSCVLRDPAVRSLMEETLNRRDKIDYSLHAFVLMPNHVHVLFSPKEARSWGKVVATWKSVSAHRINQLVGTRGALWQEEVWDRLMRHSSHFAACARYIRENPARASLNAGEFTLFVEATE